MISFTHTPNFAIHAAIVFSWGLGCSPIASNIYSRYFLHSKIAPMTVQFYVRLLVVILGISYFPHWNFFYTTFPVLIASLFVGTLSGFIIVRFELWNERQHYAQLARYRQSGQHTDNIMEKEVGEVEPMELGLDVSKIKVKDWKDRSLSYIHEVKIKKEPYFAFTLVGIAFLEEIIFRGYLIQLLLKTPFYISYPGIFLLAILFGAKHVHARAREFLAKSFLGILTTLQTLVLGNIISACITHGYLNYYAYQARKKIESLEC